MYMRSSPAGPSGWSRCTLLLSIVLLAAPACGEDPAGVSATELRGVWSLGDNPQVWGVIAGSMTFSEDGTFIVSGSVSGSASHELVAQGTWVRTGDMVTLTVDQEVSTWQLARAREYIRFLELAGMTRWFSIFSASAVPD